MNDVTEDYILNKAIRLWQPKHGYRVAIDPIILAHEVNIIPKQKILDVGSGVGTISLILKYKDPSQNLFAIDIDPLMCKLCEKNARENNLSIKVYNQNVESIDINEHYFDCIVTNPPFYDYKNFRISKNKQIANFETISLKIWIEVCLNYLSNNGNFYIIHISERLNEILYHIEGKLGQIEILPIYSYKNQDAKRIIVKGKKGSKQATKILPPLIIHNENKTYTDKISRMLNGDFL